MRRSGALTWLVVGSIAAIAVTAVAYEKHRQSQRRRSLAAEKARQAPPPPSTPAPAPPAAAPAPRMPASAASPAGQASLAAATPAPPPQASPAPALVAPIVEEAPALPRRTSVSSYWYEGADGHRRALAEQRRAGAPMLVYFRVDWCAYCRRMDSEVLPAAPVSRFLADVVKVRVNPETSPEDRALTASYGVSAYPSVWVIPAAGAPPQRVPHFSRKGSESMEATAEKFVQSCEAVGLRQARGLISEGATKARAGDLAGAQADLDRAIELDPRSAEAFFWRGYTEARAGARGKAVGDFKRAIDLDPKEPFPYAELAGLYQQAGQLDDALAILTRLTEIAPDWQQGRAFLLRGYSHGKKGDVERAAADYAEACRRGQSRACQVARPPAP